MIILYNIAYVHNGKLLHPVCVKQKYRPRQNKTLFSQYFLALSVWFLDKLYELQYQCTSQSVTAVNWAFETSTNITINLYIHFGINHKLSHRRFKLLEFPNDSFFFLELSWLVTWMFFEIISQPNELSHKQYFIPFNTYLFSYLSVSFQTETLFINHFVAL